MKYSLVSISAALLLAACQRHSEDQPAPKPTAKFTVPATVTVNKSLRAQNTSANASTYLWAWGDGSPADSASSHTFSQTGTYRVRLQATGPGGTDTTSKAVQVVYARPVAAFATPTTAETYAALQLQNLSTGATSYLWSWGDGTADATGTTPSHAYARLGTYRVRLQATGLGGTDTTSRIVQVNRLDALNIGRLAGNYYGRWIIRQSGAALPNGPTVSTGYTTRHITVLNATTVQVDNAPGTEYPLANISSSRVWEGHAPQRAHTDFYTFVPQGNVMRIQLLQVEQAGDSIYFDNSSGQLALSSSYQFYGKKQP